MNFELRFYQQDIITKTINSTKSTLIQVPTGGGKTVIAKEIAIYLVNRGLQILFVAPKIILMEQTAEVFKGLKPHIVHGINEYDRGHHVLISTIQTASRRDINPDVIFVDEIHYGFDGKMLQKLIKDKSNTRVIGLSATPFDKNGRQLEGFDLILDQYDLKYMVDNKYLVPIKSDVLTKIRNLDNVKVVAGEYNLKELGKIVSDNQTILEIVQSTAEYILEYKKTIVFAVDINHAELLTKAYLHEGFSVAVLHSKLSKDEIDRNIRRFREGQIKILVSVLMLTTGFDVPDTDVAVIARPTKSQNLYKQMAGRVLRLAEGKTHAVLLDCANVIENLGMPLDPIRIIESNENGTNKQKCRSCRSENLSLRKKDNESYWECNDCGHIKEIENGAYECKICGILYTHNAQFEYKNNKLYLVCPKCPYPTLISEYTGEETFVSLDDDRLDKLKENFHLIIDKHLDNQKSMVRDEEYKKYISSKAFVKKAKNTGYLVSKGLMHEPRDQNLRRSLQEYIDTFIKKINQQEVEHLPFVKAREFVRGLNLKSVEEWIEYLLSKKLPLNIPGNPENAYRNKGWISIDDWLGFGEAKKNQQYLSFEDARLFVRSLELSSMNEWSKYTKGQLEGYKQKPDDIPEKPQKTYKNKGWIDFNDWLGLDKLIAKELDNLMTVIANQNLDEIYEAYLRTIKITKEQTIKFIVQNLDQELFANLMSKIPYFEKDKFMNYCLELNLYDKFVFLSKSTYQTEHNRKFENGKLVDLDEPYFTTHKLLSFLDSKILLNYLKTDINRTNEITKYIFDNLNLFSDSVLIDIFLMYTNLHEYELGKKLLNIKFTLNDIWREKDLDSADIENLLEQYQDYWKEFDFSYTIGTIGEDPENNWFDLNEFESLFDVLNRHNIKIIVDDDQYTQLGICNLINSEEIEFFSLLYKNILHEDYKIFNMDFLTYALGENSYNISSYLIDMPFAKTIDHFYFAVYHGNELDIIQKLYKREYNLNSFVDNMDQTLLHLCVQNDKPEIIEFLLKNSADYKIKNTDNLTAYELAKQLNNLNIIKKFEEVIVS